MDDENGLELSLCLPGCRSSAKSKEKNDNPSDTKVEEGDRTSKLIDDFKEFLDGGTCKQEAGNDCSSRAAEIEERPEANHKRKGLFHEICSQKKHELEVPLPPANSREKGRPSHISITTDYGSTAGNEDVADSEVEGSTSRLVSHHDDGVKQYIGVVSGPPGVLKDVHAVMDAATMDLQGQKKFTISTEKEFKVGNMPYGISFPAQPVNIVNVPHSITQVKESNSVGAPNTSGYPLPNVVQIAALNGERLGSQSAIAVNLPVMFGYSSVQLPVLDNSCGIISHPQQLHPSTSSRFPPNPVTAHKSSEAFANEGRALEQAKGDNMQNASEAASSSQIEDDVKGRDMTTGAKDESDKTRPEGFSSEFPAIRPGIAADVKFGGSGSYPNLPWVSTKGPGPNGRTISGVTYRYSATQIKIVCACHGLHLSPEEFIQHAGEEQTNSDPGTGLVSLPNGNPAASAKS